jgi:agmatinase
MNDISHFDSNIPGNPKNTIFGLPFTEEEARLVILTIPWEVTVSCGSGTSRCGEHIFNASMQVDLFDPESGDPDEKRLPAQGSRTLHQLHFQGRGC